MQIFNNKTVGALGEKAAVKFLKKNKYKILERNFTCRTGEIDIICQIDEYIVFVEVKTRKTDSLIEGVYAVNKQKQNHIFKTASIYLSNNQTDKQPRFDIIDVVFDNDGKFSIREHYVDAFMQGGSYAVF